MGQEKIPLTRNSGGVIVNDIFRDENEQHSDQLIRFGENSETLSRCQPFPPGGGRESKTEVVSVPDLLMQSLISREG